MGRCHDSPKFTHLCRIACGRKIVAAISSAAEDVIAERSSERLISEILDALFMAAFNKAPTFVASERLRFVSRRRER